nr:dihydroxy-acid dehydratase [Jiangella alkaliphila]
MLNGKFRGQDVGFGRRIVAMVDEDLWPSAIMTRAAFANAIRANAKLLRADDPALDVADRALTLDVDDDELERRRAAWKPPEPAHATGYGWLYTQHVVQADREADVVGGSG